MDHCYDACGATFLEAVLDAASGNTTLVPRPNSTGPPFPRGMRGGNVSAEDGSIVFVDGYWHAEPGCFNPCVRECTSARDANCSSGCHDGRCGDNVTAAGRTQIQAFGCLLNSTVEQSRPRCHEFCELHVACAEACVDAYALVGTSAERVATFPQCARNCSSATVALHAEICHNHTLMLEAAKRPKYVNETSVCLASIWPTCSLMCLGVSIRNMTHNTTLFPQV